MEKYLYGNGGPIILVQVENEYGSFSACDRKYSVWLKNETDAYVGDKAVLFTNDGPVQLPCGKIPGVLATLDFGTGNSSTEHSDSSRDLSQFLSGSNNETDRNWQTLRRHQPDGPLVNSEYYPGWLTHWQENMAQVQTKPVIDTFV